MSYEIIKNVRMTDTTIELDQCSNNVHPRTFYHRVFPNNGESKQEIKKWLEIGAFQPQHKGKHVYKMFGVTKLWTGEAVN